MRRLLFAACVALLAVSAAGVGSASAGSRKDPLLAFTFTVKIDGGAVEAFFKSVGGLSMETEVTDFQEGGAPGTVRKLPGRSRPGNLVLKREFPGEVAEDGIHKWLRAIHAGQDVRKSISIVILRDQSPIATYEFSGCFPVKWELSELDASKSEVSIETIEIAHEGMTIG